MTEQIILDLPAHQNPTSPQRTACAPYNFVPLPETVVRAVDSPDKLPDHDTYADPDYPHTGYFDVTLTTRSPLYVRCGPTRDAYDRQQRGEPPETPYHALVKNRPEFFYTRDPGEPLIPGSSLRGMLRAVVEIASYGKVQPVTNKKLFFRSVDDSSLGYAYRQRMVGDAQGEKKVKTGFLHYDGTGPTRTTAIAPCEALRVAPEQIFACFRNAHRHDNDQLRLLRNANDYPNWHSYQYKQVWVRPDDRNALFVHDMRTSCPKRNKCTCDPANPVNTDCLCRSEGWQRGLLVVTGWAPKSQKRVKGADGATRMAETVKKEFVFLFPEQGQRPEPIPVSEDTLSRFTDDDQITHWQEKAFHHDSPIQGCRERDGLLRTQPPAPGDPVFFLCEDDALTFFGRAQMFRLPYQHNPRDLVHENLWQEADVDYAEALFGYVKSKAQGGQQGDKKRAYAGRVAVTDAVWDKKVPPGSSNIWLRDSAIVPHILASPKPTAFQHYLVQYSDDKLWLMHYDRSPHDLKVFGQTKHNPNLVRNPWRDHTTIRGHKRYWHQGRRSADDIELPPAKLREALEKQPEGKQFTQLKPVGADATFSFRVYFENLSDRELGALCWSLHPLGPASVDARQYCHSLGMGKSLGMGAVSLHAYLHLTDRSRRYATLFDTGDDWETGANPEGEDLAQRDKLELRVRPFEQHVLSTLGYHGPAQHLYDLRRVGMFLLLLEWPGIVPAEPTPDNPYNHRANSRSMIFDLPYVNRRDSNEFRNRPVLPDPSAFDRPLSGRLAPTPSPSQPSRGAQAQRVRSQSQTRQATPRLQAQQAPHPTSSQSEPALPEIAPLSAEIREIQASESKPSEEEIRPGKRLKATILEVTPKGRVRLQLHITNHEPLTVDVPVGLRMRLGDTLTKGREIGVTVKDVDRKAKRVIRVDLT